MTPPAVAAVEERRFFRRYGHVDLRRTPGGDWYGQRTCDGATTRRLYDTRPLLVKALVDGTDWV